MSTEERAVAEDGVEHKMPAQSSSSSSSEVDCLTVCDSSLNNKHWLYGGANKTSPHVLQNDRHVVVLHRRERERGVLGRWHARSTKVQHRSDDTPRLPQIRVRGGRSQCQNT
ncbi:unnamed protein product [Amoebophrya sp. A25]|nr:unnamed protein product [Amoebophrya sp. A25]|eukprot:GSA25T00000728001.1